jgi:hypothetical protein
MTFFDRLEDVAGFAGERYELANVSPEAQRLLSHFDKTVSFRGGSGNGRTKSGIVTHTRLMVSNGLPELSLLEAELVNHWYEPHFHDELVLAVTELGTAQINC